VLVADATRNALLLRGPKELIEEVRAALPALGESPAGANVRTITIEKGSAVTLAEALAKLLKKMRPNPVQVVVPGGKELLPAPKPDPEKGKAEPAGKKQPGERPITITAFGNRLVIASDDPEAMALAVELVRLYTDPAAREGNWQLIRLKHVSAGTVAQTLYEAFNGPPPDRAGGKGLPQADRLSVGVYPSGNLVLIKATPLDLLTVRQLVSALDVEPGEEAMQTRLIGPLRHARAAELARLVREVFADATHKARLSVGVDERTNSLVVRCGDALQREIEALVRQLDQKAADK
jgi:type II secretory pathway component GspD/PulD (secretin)